MIFKRWWGRGTKPVRVRVLIKGRIGLGWLDIDQTFALREGATLTELFDAAERKGVPMRDAVESSPHLAQTLMWNGERCPVEEYLERPLRDGDEIYLLSPLAGG